MRFSIISLFALCFCFLSCSKDPENPLLGKWQDGTSVLEFKVDGSWVSTAPERSLPTWGTYEILSKEKLIMRYANPPYPEYAKLHKYKIEDAQLKIFAYEATELALTRISDTNAH